MYRPLICIIYVTEIAANRNGRIRRHGNDRFETVALAHSAFLMRLARRLTGDPSSAEDLFQDTYLKAYRAFDGFEGASRCRAWLKRIMINTYINMYNRQKKVIFQQHGNEEITQYPDLRSPTGTVRDDLNEDRILRNYVCDEIKKSLMTLPDLQRMIVILYDLVGLPYKEISGALSLPIGTVKSSLHRGRKSLRENLLAGNGDGHGRRVPHSCYKVLSS